MDLSGRPLLDTKPDQALVGGREAEATAVLTAVEHGRNVLVAGGRGTGKTTLLRHLTYTLRKRHPESPPAFVEGAVATSARDLLELLARRLGIASAAGRSGLVGEPDLTELVHRLREAAPKRGTRVILIDEPPPPVAQTVFGRLRDELWQLPFVWVVAASDRDTGLYREPPVEAFFDTVLHLEPLAHAAQEELLGARAGDRGRRIAQKLDEGNPRRLLAMARAALQDGEAPSALVARQSSRSEAAARLGRPAAMLLAELEALGSASASDEQLLRRLGWTRTRAVQVLSELAEAGLVTSSEVKGRVGRPRKVYRPA